MFVCFGDCIAFITKYTYKIRFFESCTAKKGGRVLYPDCQCMLFAGWVYIEYSVSSVCYFDVYMHVHYLIHLRSNSFYELSPKSKGLIHFEHVHVCDLAGGIFKGDRAGCQFKK
jgi:hypothetical protein